MIDISGCAVQYPVVNQMIEQVKASMTELQIPAYNERTREGVVRTVVVRVGEVTGHVQLTAYTHNRYGLAAGFQAVCAAYSFEGCAEKLLPEWVGR
ncbi:hypothetical protein [Paenibacillus chitinolyticus]|uniref:hypothetical protein n=1 Tax=Paenibacillus chitinolyticus TaxID=79263 RepID=UPI00295F1C94|nr:hypothetical protein [Paenibacillus chitinolyticus]